MKKSVYLFLAFLILLILFIPNILTKAESQVIYLDPGHGGFDGGCVGNGLIEKDITLNITLKLKRHLESSGYVVYLTREVDKALSNDKANDIYKRVALINNAKTLIYISIHANSYPHESVKGAQTFYKQSENNKKLAELIQQSLQQIDLKNHRFAKSITGKYLLEHTNKTGCLVEVGFLSNKEESVRLTDEHYQNKIAYAIYAGILSYLESI